MAITTDELSKQCELVKTVRADLAVQSKLKTGFENQKEMAETRLVDMLNEAGLLNFRSPFGLASITTRSSVRLPETPEEWALLAEYAKKVGKYDELFRPGSQALNSFYKEEFEAAKERGDDDFEVPGLKGVTIKQSLSFKQS